MEMGCYGLGVSRILQASVEVLCEDKKIRWPSLIAPYQVCIIPQMVSSKTFWVYSLFGRGQGKKQHKN